MWQRKKGESLRKTCPDSDFSTINLTWSNRDMNSVSQRYKQLVKESSKTIPTQSLILILKVCISVLPSFQPTQDQWASGYWKMDCRLMKRDIATSHEVSGLEVSRTSFISGSREKHWLYINWLIIDQLLFPLWKEKTNMNLFWINDKRPHLNKLPANWKFLFPCTVILHKFANNLNKIIKPLTEQIQLDEIKVNV